MSRDRPTSALLTNPTAAVVEEVPAGLVCAWQSEHLLSFLGRINLVPEHGGSTI